jgi:hypothetical protein
MSTSQILEKLGEFYLGTEYDVKAQGLGESRVLYDSKDLVTHAVCVGMTGSGKTGLCLALLEEAAIDGIPAIIIDPKGDLSNLLLTFPNLEPRDFRPWVNEDDARAQGVTPDELAAQQATMWRTGLAESGQNGERIAKLRAGAEFAIYTPGSNAGLPVSVLKGFVCPAQEVKDDAEVYRERIAGTASSLLGLMGIDADPLQGREHILLSAIIADAWEKGETVDLAMLIQRIQMPPFETLGVMSLENVYASKDRFSLAMALNNLLASPGLGAWMEGEPLDIQAMLYTPDGKARHAIFSIAHLDDAQRMFFVSLLLNQVLAWTRTQTGTTSLRALVYMDEIAGYFPPTANPPSKRPLLTLMKQGRGFGVGVVLATQNPVDLDYKGLANAGTWFIGRLQTERDKLRVLDGLEGAMSNASASFDRAEMNRLLSGLGKRVFLMNNVHEDHPVVFQTRWCLSYLRGPLTRAQIKSLMDPIKTACAARASSSAGAPTFGQPRDALPSTICLPRTEAARSSVAPVLASDIHQFFLPPRATDSGACIVYKPHALGLAKVYYSDTKLGVDADVAQAMLTPIVSGPVAAEWDEAMEVDISETDLGTSAKVGAAFENLPASATLGKTYEQWKSACADAMFKRARFTLFRASEQKLTSRPGEKERDFRLRLAQVIREDRDARKEALRRKYAPKRHTLLDRKRRAEATAEMQRQQSTSAKVQAAVGVGAAILGAFLGRKVMSAANVRSAGSAMGRVQKTFKETGDVSRADETVEAVDARIQELEREFETEAASIDGGIDPMTAPLETLVIKPKKTNIKVRAVVLVWAPFAIRDGVIEPFW